LKLLAAAHRKIGYSAGAKRTNETLTNLNDPALDDTGRARIPQVQLKFVLQCEREERFAEAVSLQSVRW
jgi:hypothetical protein